MLSLNPHAKNLPLIATLSTQDFLSARLFRPTLQVLAHMARLLQRLRERHGYEWQRNLSKDDNLPTDTSTSGCYSQRQSACGRLSAPQDAKRPSCLRSHPCECLAPSQRAHAARASGTPIPKSYPTTLTRRQVSETRSTRSSIYIGRPPRLRLILLPCASGRLGGTMRDYLGVRQRAEALSTSSI